MAAIVVVSQYSSCSVLEGSLDFGAYQDASLQLSFPQLRNVSGALIFAVRHALPAPSIVCWLLLVCAAESPSSTRTVHVADACVLLVVPVI